MNTYSEKSTRELIDLLFKEEDRVTLEHIRELAARPDALQPLREILRNDYYWNEGRHGEWWILYHAFTILSATRNPEVLPDVIDALVRASQTDFDWLQEVSPAALAYFGEPAVETLINFVSKHRDSHKEDDNYTFVRSRIVTALTRIALATPATRERIIGLLCSLLTDPQESDPTFLGFIVGDALVLDRERGMEAARDAFERDAVDEFISGDFQETIEFFDQYPGADKWEYTQDLFEFYLPEEIARRQERWKREAEEEERWEAEKEAERRRHKLAGSSTRPDWTPPAALQPVAPTGYSIRGSGGFVRQEKTGRNDPCPCGSGKKYKKCCGK
jgi:hypothetical protein